MTDERNGLYTPIEEHEMPIPPWERAEAESDPAWEAFALYRDKGGARSIRDVAKALDKSATLVGRWNSKYRWRERVIAYDYELDRIARAEQAEVTRKMAGRHAQLAAGSLAALSLPVQAWLKRVKAAEDAGTDITEDLAHLPTEELLQLVHSMTLGIQRMTGAERLSRGEPTEITYAQEFQVPISIGGDDDDTDSLDPATLAGVLAGLEQAGLVRRPTIPEDGVPGGSEADRKSEESDSG